MIPDAVDMDVFAAHVRRPPFWPTTGGDKPDTGPGNGDRPGPCHRPTNDELHANAQRTVTDVWAAIGRSRRARGADTELREVA